MRGGLHALAPRDIARLFRQLVTAEQRAADGAGEELVTTRCGRRPEKRRKARERYSFTIIERMSSGES
jgi:hypothetical protein